MRRAPRGLSLALAVVVLGCATASARRRNLLLFLTDFGVKDGAVAACKGVMWSIAPDLTIADLTHESPPYDVEAAGEQLEQAVPFYPPGTVVVAVVDPGVGGARKPLAALTQAGHFLVGPDNGIFTRMLEREGLESAVELAESKYWRQGLVTSTFHGRDIFAAVGAHLANGVPLKALGPALSPKKLEAKAPVVTEAAIDGEVRYVEDPYGNVVTNIPMSLMEGPGLREGEELHVELAGKLHRLAHRKTFSDVGVGEALALPHSRGVLSFSINQGDFARAYGIKRGDKVRVRR